MRNSGKSDSFVEIPKAPTEVYSEGAFSGIKYYFRLSKQALGGRFPMIRDWLIPRALLI